MPDNTFIDRTLSNGLRVVIEPMPHVASAAAGFLVRTGARDETPDLAGVSHFLEHMCFKGTARRTWQQITIDFDNMGSTYNAFTSKEKTFYFGWVRVEDLDRQIELLADMMRSVVPPDEFETEKKVILEEIAMSDDQIDRRVYDLLHEQAYPGHPLAWPVLGTTDTIAALTRDQLYDYFQDRYSPANTVLVVAGAVDPDAVLSLAERHCGGWAPGRPRPQRHAPPAPPRTVEQVRAERFSQQAVAVAYPAAPACDPDRETADVMTSILGGHNSRFYWNIIQAGIAPHVSAFRLDYCDTALVVAFGFCDPDQAGSLRDAMQAEIEAIASRGVTPEEVQRVKNRSRTALATEAEAPYYRLMQLAGEIDVLGRPRNIAQRLAEIDKVTPETIAAYLRKWPLEGDALVVTLGPGGPATAPSKGP